MKKRLWAFCCAAALLFTTARAEALRPQGSAFLLSGRTLLVSVYAQDEDTDWTQEELAYHRKALGLAAEYIEAAARNCGHAVELVYDADDLCYQLDDPTAAADSQSDDVSVFCATISSFLDELPLDALANAYDADSFAFLVFIDAIGGSYAMPYYVGAPATEYNEFAVVYTYSLDAPEEHESVPVYAHELLHLFGAVDLYMPMREDGVTADIVRYLEQTEPDELMRTTFEPDDSTCFTGISQSLSELTLYLIGLIDDTPLLDRFPTLRRQDAGAFCDLSASFDELGDDAFELSPATAPPFALDWTELPET